MVIFDQATGTRATSQPEPEGPPPRFPGLADGPVSWGGAVVQLSLVYARGPNPITSDGFNEHLDTLEGRISMQLEWRALRRAVESGGNDRAEAIADALAFRRERRRLFPGAADNERRDEIREGLASYTGVAV